MGIIVGFIALILAVGALVLAWPLGWLVGGYRRAVVLLSLLLFLAGWAIVWVQPIEQSRPQTAIWPISVGGSGVLAVILMAYGHAFAWLWRLVARLLGRGQQT
ncbi:MAG TPA: hypothetical protein PK812_06460 [Beijerinckiaceae bacterium]|nr:hypothetical protein [Beijerinckiaceae bacterium]